MDRLRERWLGVGTQLIVRATLGICAGSLRNADLGRAATSARIADWSAVLPLYSGTEPGRPDAESGFSGPELRYSGGEPAEALRVSA